MERPYVKIEEVDNLTITETVEQVSDRTAKDEGEGEGKAFLTLLHLLEEKKDTSYGNQGDHDKEQGPGSTFFACEDPEGPPRIPHVGEIEKPTDHLHILIKGQFLLNSMLGPLIDHENPAEDDQKDPVLSLHFSPNPASDFEF